MRKIAPAMMAIMAASMSAVENRVKELKLRGEFSPPARGTRHFSHSYRYGGNKSGKYWNHPKFGGAQEIARRAAKWQRA